MAADWGNIIATVLTTGIVGAVTAYASGQAGKHWVRHKKPRSATIVVSGVGIKTGRKCLSFSVLFHQGLEVEARG